MQNKNKTKVLDVTKKKKIFQVCALFSSCARQCHADLFCLHAAWPGTATPRIPGFALLPLINGFRSFHLIHSQAFVDLDIRWMKCSSSFWIGAQIVHKVNLNLCAHVVKANTVICVWRLVDRSLLSEKWIYGAFWVFFVFHRLCGVPESNLITQRLRIKIQWAAYLDSIWVVRHIEMNQNVFAS